MKIKHLLFILSLAIPMTIIASDEVYPSLCTDTFPSNDSIVSWQDEGMVILEDGKGFAVMYNNTQGIFFRVLVKDRRLQQQLLRRGLVVYVDPNGKKKKKYAVHFPTLSHRVPGKHPDSAPGDTAGMFGDIKPAAPHDRHHRKQSKAERERMLKFLVSQLSSQPATFHEDENETILSQDSAKVTAAGNNIVFSAFISYDRMDKIGKKGEISLGISIKERESSDDNPRGGMFGPPPGMMGGGMMPPPPGMGGHFHRGDMLKETKSFMEWLVFSTKNCNFTTLNYIKRK